jgi:predicted alpha-1,6-mannanase (GH76 family)
LKSSILIRSVALMGAAAIFFCTARAQQSTASPRERVQLSTRALQSWYDEPTGLWKTTGWWNSANAMTTLADEARIAHTHEFDPVFANTFTAAQKKAAGFLNDYYDDEGWWALGWIDAYDATHRGEYLAMAESIFHDMSGGWSDACGGGIWWSKDRKYKNAIANELFLSVAAHLASSARSRRERKAYLAWAVREWRWFSASGMINASHLVNDGLDAKCANNQKTTWTYNQGVIVGALSELSHSDHDPALLVAAKSIAEAALSAPALIDAKGILHEPCEPNCGGDGSQFKGIFARNLRALEAVAPIPRYKQFVAANADSIWSGAHPPDYHLGLIWTAPFGPADASTQSSALDILVSALRNEE